MYKSGQRQPAADIKEAFLVENNGHLKYPNALNLWVETSLLDAATDVVPCVAMIYHLYLMSHWMNLKQRP